jgi:hypothetical protein
VELAAEVVEHFPNKEIVLVHAGPQLMNGRGTVPTKAANYARRCDRVYLRFSWPCVLTPTDNITLQLAGGQRGPYHLQRARGPVWHQGYTKLVSSRHHLVALSFTCLQRRGSSVCY